MKNVRNFIFIFSLLAFMWSEISINHDGEIKNLTSENRAESEAQPHTSTLSASNRNTAKMKLDEENTIFSHLPNYSRLKPTAEQSFTRTDKLFIVHRELLL